MKNIHAEVTVTFTMKNVCTRKILKDLGMTLDEVVQDLIDSEGLMGVAEDNFTIESIKEIPCT